MARIADGRIQAHGWHDGKEPWMPQTPRPAGHFKFEGEFPTLELAVVGCLILIAVIGVGLLVWILVLNERERSQL